MIFLRKQYHSDLKLSETEKIHPLWCDIGLNFFTDAISPIELARWHKRIGIDSDWVNWLLVSHPIVMIEKKKTKSSKSPQMFYRLLGHTTWAYVNAYLSYIHGPEKASNIKVPVTVLPMSQVNKYKEIIIATEVVNSRLLRPSDEQIPQIFELANALPSLSYLRSHKAMRKFTQRSDGKINAILKIAGDTRHDS
ncbi:MAG: hypothetical protein IBX55_18075 [Methyloprofundus sp.]|nr:hypothetical protein [Methyloprofundus sp.]